MALAATARALRRGHRCAAPAAFALLHLVALACFVRGFLLTRVHLTERAAATSPDAAAKAPYDRVVWLLIDALRYDFVVADGRYRCPEGSSKDGSGVRPTCHQGHMPFLTELGASPAARSFMFVSDAPTTTTQRLTSLATGGLPSFFDVSNSFSAGAVADDNLLAQLAGAGKRMAFLGDTTWQQLFPAAWAWSRPLPCFNVRDLDTVDDGVWAHLPGALTPAGAATWDGLLVAHYLGVDHCGHTHGVSSPEMAAKLRQMDSHVRQVVDALLEQAAPGGTFERTLLLVSGDHGQTLGGDHGGGSPEEVDSALVAVDIGALRSLRAGAGGSGGGGRKGGDGAENKAAAEAMAAMASCGALAACRANCSCGVEGNQCAPDLAQIDLTPTLAAMLGVPTPFANLGALSSELWQLTAARLGLAAPSCEDLGAAWGRTLGDAVLANAHQVHAYLSAYAAASGASFSKAALGRLEAAWEGVLTATGFQERKERPYAYLAAAAAVAREQWTQFDDVSMAAGLALFAATLVLQAAVAFVGDDSSSSSVKKPADRARAADPTPSRLAALGTRLQGWELAAPWRAGSVLRVPTLRAWLVGLAAVHAAGVFSFFYLLSEGRNVCILVGVASALLALVAARSARSSGGSIRGAAALGVMALRFNGLMTILGVAHHTGQGFWARLTVHEPKPAGDVERGWHGKLDRLKQLAIYCMSASGLDRLPATTLAALQHGLRCTVPILALAAISERAQAPRGLLQRALALAAFASAAAYLQLGSAVQSGLLPSGVTLQQLSSQHIWPVVPANWRAAAEAAFSSAAAPALAAWPAAGAHGAVLAALPLQDLLPHVTYTLCGAGAALWLLQVLRRRLHGGPAALAAAQLVLAVLLQVSDRSTPLILLLACLQLVAITRLLRKRAELLASGGGGGSVRGVAGEAAAVLALVAPQLFYASGHMCEFAGLQYTAGFVGSDEFHLWRSGALVSVNTFGALLLALLLLSTLVEQVTGAEAASRKAEKKGRGGGAKRGGHATSALQQAVAVAGLVRAAAAFCAALSAGIQRRHLYVWALFAPRFAFEACFLAVADVALLLLAALEPAT